MTAASVKRSISLVIECFGEHRRAILNHQQLSTTTPVSVHFNQDGHSINNARLIPIELIRTKRDSVRKTREAHLIKKAKTLHPFGINKHISTRKGVRKIQESLTFMIN